MNNDVMHTAKNKRSKGMQFANHRIVPYIITIDMYGVLQYQAHHVTFVMIFSKVAAFFLFKVTILNVVRFSVSTLLRFPVLP